MTVRNYTNAAQPQTLTADIDDVDVILPVGDTSSYPNAPFTIVLERSSDDQEVVLCTGKTSVAFTVTRGYDGTVAVDHLTGASVEHTVAALDYAEANAHANLPHISPSIVGAKGELLVGTADDTVDNLAAGTGGYNLIPDAAADPGLRWEKSRGTIVCTAGARPTLGLYEGVRIYETDTKLFYVYNGALWVPEPGQILGNTKVTTGSSYATGMTIRLTLSFTMPTLAGGRKVLVSGSCFYTFLQTLATGQFYFYTALTKSSGVGIGQAFRAIYGLNVSALGDAPITAIIDNTDIAAGTTTVYYKIQVTNSAGTNLSHAMVATADAPAIIYAMIV